MINITFKTELDELSSIEKRFNRFMKRYKVGSMKHHNRKDMFRSPGRFIREMHGLGARDFLQLKYPQYRDELSVEAGHYTTQQFNRIRINMHIIYLMHYCAVDEPDLFVYYTL